MVYDYDSNINMALFDLARRHKYFDEKLWQVVRNQPICQVNSQATPESRALYNMSRTVFRNLCLNKGFTRLKLSKHGILYGKIEPEHNIDDMLCEHFMERFPLYYIILDSKKGVYVGKNGIGIKVVLNNNMVDVIKKFENMLPLSDALSLSNEHDFTEEIYRVFYDTHLINQRKNKRYFNCMMPKKYRKQHNLSVEMEINRKEKQLSEFF